MNDPNDIFDEWLVLRCQSGDAKALSLLVKRWQPRLLGLAIRILGERDAAEDAVQASWMDVVKRIQSLKDPRAIRPWLFRIVANKCKDSIRSRSRRRKSEMVTDPQQLPDSDLSSREPPTFPTDQIGLLRVKLRTLDERQQEIIRLHYLDSLSVEAIASQLSIPIGTVKSRLFHARKKLKQLLSGEEP